VNNVDRKSKPHGYRQVTKHHTSFTTYCVLFGIIWLLSNYGIKLWDKNMIYLFLTFVQLFLLNLIFD